MNRSLKSSLALFALTLLTSKCVSGETVKLFNGKNLDGWKLYVRGDADPKKTWNAEDGILVCTGKPNGYIMTEKAYGDYKLTLQWRWVKGKARRRNSGVLLHLGDKHPSFPWPKSAEAQLMSGNAGDFWLIGNFGLKIDKKQQDKRTARHFFRLKKKGVELPIGEWNTYEIVCDGGKITLKINGMLVNEGSGAELTKGHIALQSEGSPIHFRNIELTPLK